MAEKVVLVVDTNSCRSDAGRHNQFFGYREELNKLKANNARIIIPNVVIDEISAQKRRSLKCKKEAHISNPFFQILGLNQDDINNIDIDRIISQLLDSEVSNFEVRALKDQASAFTKIYKWSMDKHPPFSQNDKAGDKGFKDACIVCIIDELLEELGDEYLVFLTKDDLLRRAFEHRPGVKTISEFDEASKYFIGAFIDDYLVDKIKEELGIKDFSMTDSWQNLNEDWVVQLGGSDNLKLVVIDSRAKEIVDTYDDNIAPFLQMLMTSGSFEQTHNGISELAPLLPFLRIKELEELIMTAITNDQIYSIANDCDVKQFYKQIYEAIAGRLDAGVDSKFNEYFK